MTKLRSRRGKRTGKKRSGDEPVFLSTDENDDGVKEEFIKDFNEVVQLSEPDKDRFLTGDEKVFNAGIALAEYCARHLEPFMEFLGSVGDDELTLDGVDKCYSFLVSNDASDDSGVGFSAQDNSDVGLGSLEQKSLVKECSFQGSASGEREVFDCTSGAICSQDSSSKDVENYTEKQATCPESPGPSRRHGCRKLSSDESESEEEDQLVKIKDSFRANLIPISPDITSFRTITRPDDQFPSQRSLLQQFKALEVDSTQSDPAEDEAEELLRTDAADMPPEATKSNAEVATTSDEDIKVLLDSTMVRSKSKAQKATGSYPVARKHRQIEQSSQASSSPLLARSTRRRSRASIEESVNLNESSDVVILSEITRRKSFNSSLTVAADSTASKSRQKAANIGAARGSRKRSNKSRRKSDFDDDIEVISPAPLAKKMKADKPKPLRSGHGRYSLRSNRC